MRGNIKLVLILAISVMVITANSVFASTTFSDIYDQPTSLKTNSGSNHKFTFTVPAGIAEGDAINISFPSGFNLTSVIEDDLDISDDGVDLTTASDCLGIEKASVAVAAQNLVITICVGDGGAIALGSEVVIEIGTNASAYGSGINRITNPTSEATYFVWVYTSGASDMSGSIPIPIVSDDDGNVSLVIPDSGGGGGGFGGDDDGGDEEDVIDDEEPTPEPEPEPTPEPEPEPEPVPEPEPEPEPAPEPEPDLPDQGQGDVSYEEPIIETEIRVGDGQIAIDDGDVLSGSQAELLVSIDYSGEIYEVVAVIDDTTFGLTQIAEGLYSGIVPFTDGEQVITVVVKYGDDEIKTQVSEFETVQSGWVYEVINGELIAIEGAVIIVYEGDGSQRVQWSASDYGQQNPVITSSSGAVAFYVPNGIYTVSVGKSGYEDRELVVNIQNNILSPSIELVRMQVIVVDEDSVGVIEDIIDTSLDVAQAAFLTIDEIRELPIAQALADIAIPTTIAVAVGSIGALSTSFNLLSFLRFLFSSPALFFAKRKGRKIGTVYNSISKVPIDLATLRLFSKDGKLIKTTVSDTGGHYIFKAQPGIYKIDVKKSGFVFPSEYMSGKQQDVIFENIYSQGLIEVTEDNVIIATNIPLDPSQEQKYHAPKSLIFKRFLRVFCHVLAISGLVIAVVVLIIQPSIISVGIVVLHIVIYSITTILTSWKKKKGWGIVNEDNKQKPLKNTVVRLFEPEFNRLIESTVTDGSGRYAFMAGPNKYYVTFEHPEYEKREVRPIDFSSKKEPDVLTVDISLKKKS